MPPPRTLSSTSTPLESALARVGDRWSLLLVDALTGGPMRFGELQQAVPGIATNVLSERLRRLEATRVLLARPYSRRPLRHSYELTAAGRELAAALRLLAQWGADTTAEAPEHGACGTLLEARWWCPTCEEAVADPREEPPFFV